MKRSHGTQERSRRQEGVKEGVMKKGGRAPARGRGHGWSSLVHVTIVQLGTGQSRYDVVRDGVVDLDGARLAHAHQGHVHCRAEVPGTCFSLAST